MISLQIFKIYVKNTKIINKRIKKHKNMSKCNATRVIMSDNEEGGGPESYNQVSISLK